MLVEAEQLRALQLKPVIPRRRSEKSGVLNSRCRRRHRDFALTARGTVLLMLVTPACAIKPTALEATARRERHPNQEYKLNNLHPSPLSLPAFVMTKYLVGPVHRTLLHTHFGEVVG